MNEKKKIATMAVSDKGAARRDGQPTSLIGRWEVGLPITIARKIQR